MRCWKMRCWAIWRCWGPKKKSLLTYEELMAFEDIDALIAELNSSPNWYYIELSEWSHLNDENYIIPPDSNICDVLGLYTVRYVDWSRTSWHCWQ